LLKQKINYKGYLRGKAEFFAHEFLKKDGVSKVKQSYFDYHNTRCPGCSGALPQDGDTVTDYGLLGVVMITDEVGYLYALCDTCSQSIVRDQVKGVKSIQVKRMENNIEKNVARTIKH